MLFNFLKYLHPTHYFQLSRKDGTSIFPIVSNLPRSIQEEILPDNNYESELAADYDQSWRAIGKGYIDSAPTYTSFGKIPLVDEYRFIRKNFHPVWVYYVFVLRIVTLKNPIKEIMGFKKSGDQHRQNNYTDPIIYPKWNNFQSQLIANKPLITVIIPTLNRYDHLKKVLTDFQKQDYKNFEVIVVDQSDPFLEEFYSQFKLNIRVIYQREKALWLARNMAIEQAKGSLIALSEDDVRIPFNWLSNHLSCLDFFKADISAGVFFPEGTEIPEDRSYFSIASQFATGNAMLYRKIFTQIGLFDRQFEKQRMGDGEFGLRAYLYGYKCISNPYAFCIDLKVGTGGLREMGSWDSFRPKSILSPRPVPSVLYFYRKYFGKKRSILALIKTVPPSIIPYRYKKNRKLMVLGGVISLFLLPLILLQVVLSWRKAGEKLKQGSLINELE